MPHRHPGRAAAYFLLLIAVAVVLVPSAEAQTVPLAPPTRTVPPFPLPAAPALPAGCAAPTKAQCADGAWYTTDACAKDPAKSKGMQDYCTWVFQKAWVDTQSGVDPTIVPKSNPTFQGIIGPGKRVDYNKSLDPAPSPKPADKRRYPGRPRTVTTRTQPANAPRSLDWTPTVARGGGGSYATMSTTPAVTAATVQMRRDVGSMRGQPSTSATSIAKSAGLLTQLVVKPPFVSVGPACASCEEYGYKRWGDWAAFAFAAKKLGSNYRQMYAIANDPSSPFYMNKPTLLQTATTTPMPKQLALRGSKGRTPLPVNAFLVQYPEYLKDPKVTGTGAKALVTDAQKAQILALVEKSWPGGKPRSIGARNDASPLGLHREMKALFDRKYDPLDAELADISKRTGEYQELLSTRATLVLERLCASPGDPCFKCRPKPGSQGQSLPAGIQKLKEKITGMTVINPADMKGGLRGSVASRTNSLGTLAEMSGVMRDFDKQGLAAGGLGAGLQQGGMKKEKAAPFDLMQVKPGPALPNNPTPTLTAPNVNVAGGNDRQVCENALVAKIPALDAAIQSTTEQMVRWLVNELAFGDRGCLADPGPDQGNMCDWSYRLFADQLSHVFDADVERDVNQCRAEITEAAQMAGIPVAGAFTQIVKKPPNQKNVFPCTQRRDFSASAPDVRRFLDLNGNWTGRFCEAERQNVAISEQQQGISSQLTGMQWNPGDGKIFDREQDNLTLGDKDSLGAYFDYDASWEMRKTAVKEQNPMWACRFEGNASNSVKAGIYFFGDDLELFKVVGSGTAKPGATVSMNATYFDIDSMSTKTAATVSNKTIYPGSAYSVPLADPPLNLGGIEYGFWFSVGPIPIHIQFGANATAGIDYLFAGTPGDNCADLKKPSNFALQSEVDPWVSADAYADGSVSVVVASAGIRLELNLLQINIPTGVRVEAVDQSYKFKNGAHVGIDMLSGQLLAYAEVGVSPLAASFEATIFGWDGFHTDIPMFGLDKSLSAETLRIAMAGYVDSKTATCKCADTYCCSNVTCPSCPANQVKTIDGNPWVCSFSQADYQKMLAAAKTTMTQSCTDFIK